MARRNRKGRFVSGKRRSTRRSSRRSGGTRYRTRYIARPRRRGHRGVGGEGLKPSRHTLESWALAALYGYLEGKARTDSDFLLHKVPKPIPQVGFTGNVALVAWVGGHVAKQPWLKRFGNSVAHVASYQLGLHGSAFSSGDEMFSVSGYGAVSGPGDNMRLTPDKLAELANAMHAAASVSGVGAVPYEEDVEEAAP